MYLSTMRTLNGQGSRLASKVSIPVNKVLVPLAIVVISLRKSKNDSKNYSEIHLKHKLCGCKWHTKPLKEAITHQLHCKPLEFTPRSLLSAKVI